MQQPQVVSSQSQLSTPQSNNVNGTNYRNENILCAVLALLKELDESGLELVKRDIERKLSMKKQ
jgi:cilla- and flagella-associated protein